MIYLSIQIIWIIFITAKLIRFNFDTNINTPPFRWKVHKKTLQAICATAFFIDGLLYISQSGAIWIGFAIFLDIILFADTLYMRYYKNPLTISVIIHQFKLVKGIRESVLGVILKKDFILFLDLPVYVAVMVLLKNYRVAAEYRLLIGCTMIIVGLTWFLLVYRVSNRKPYFWNKKRIARDLGIIYYHISDIARYLKNRLVKKTPLTEEELERIKKENWTRHTNAYSDLAKDRNVIVVQMESMQDFLIDLTIEGREVTPNLNKLMKENIRFKNMYYQTGVGNTSDAEWLFNNSLYPIQDKPACYECQRNHFKAIGHAFKKKGYSNYAFHGNQASFWNRHLMYPVYGYDKFIDNSILENDEFIFPGLSDQSFFRQCTEFLNNKSKEGNFFSFLISLSLHHPYDYFKDDGFPVGGLEGTFIGRYMKGAHYADQCIGFFVEELKKKGMYEDTLLVMYGDHAGIPRQYRQELMDYLKIENNDFNYTKLQKVAALAHIPGHIEEMVIDKTIGQIDLLPTIANLADLELSYALGRDIFDNKCGGIVTRDKIVITDQFMVFPNQKIAYDLSTGTETPIKEELDQRVHELMNKLEISDLIIEKDALSSL